MKIPDTTKIQSVDLKVRSLSESLKFYSDLIGFKIIEQSANTAYLSATGEFPYLIGLHEDTSAQRRQRGTTGLFHTAIRFTSRKELARVFMRLFNNGTKFQGFSDHLVSEAIYLADPDENGVELYTDKPKSEWHWKAGQIEMDTLPLNLNVLTRELDNPDVWNGAHIETDVGHIHLNVSTLHKAQDVYSLLLGMNITTSAYPGALFFSAGGYHHHIGANVWQSRHGSPPPENTLGLMQFTINVPDSKYLETIGQRAEEENLLVSKFDGKELTILDFDKTKIKLTLPQS